MSVCSIEHYLTPEQKLNFRQIISGKSQDDILDLYDKYFFDSKFSERLRREKVTVTVKQSSDNKVVSKGNGYTILYDGTDVRQFERMLLDVMMAICDPSRKTREKSKQVKESLFSEIFGDGSFDVFTEYGLLRENVSSMSIEVLSKIARLSKSYKEIAYQEIYSRIIENINDPDYRELYYFYPELQTEDLKQKINTIAAPYRRIVGLINSLAERYKKPKTGYIHIKNTDDSAKFLYELVNKKLDPKRYKSKHRRHVNILWSAGIRMLKRVFPNLTDPENEYIFSREVQLLITSPSVLQIFMLAEKDEKDRTEYVMKVIATKCFAEDYTTYELFLKFIPVNQRVKIDQLFNGNMRHLYFVLRTLMTVYLYFITNLYHSYLLIPNMITFKNVDITHFSRLYALNAQQLVADEGEDSNLEELQFKVSNWVELHPNAVALQEDEKNKDLVLEPWMYLDTVYTKQDIALMFPETLIAASKYGDLSLVNRLLDTGADPNTDTEEGKTPLIFASERGYTDIVKLLLSKGKANPNTTSTSTGNTALIFACRHGYTDVVQALLNANADPNASNNIGETSLMYSSFNGHTKIVELLLDAEADVNAIDEDEMTALIGASEKGYTNIVDLLLGAGADSNASNEFGSTPLTMASKLGHTKIVKLLLDTDADPNGINENGNPLVEASYQGHTEIVGLLLARGAKADPRGAVEALNTPIMGASQFGHVEIVEMLLARGANPNLADEDGETAITLAKKKEIVKLLRKYASKRR